MYKCKHARKTKRPLNAKTVALIVALTLVFCTAVGGTVAWLIDKTDTVTNTFTYGDINIELTETTGDLYKMMPGTDLAKDPTIFVDNKSEDCWLYIKIAESGNFDDFMTYQVADGWTQLKDANDQPIEGIYFRTVDSGDAAAAAGLSILKDNKVSVLSTVTKGQLNALTEQTLPSLAFTGYAVQRDANFTNALDAWNAIAGNNNP